MRWTNLGWVVIGFLLLLVLSARVALLRYRHLLAYEHAAPFGLHADVIVRDGDIGIPGITKMHEAELTNFGFLPVRVTRCEFLDDTLSLGVMVAYGVERWNAALARWQTIAANTSSFCKPYPLGIVEARLTTKWLWPGQTLATGEEATAARSPPLKKGDSARFVLHPHPSDRNATPIATAPFLIEESPSIDTASLRVRH